jgi:exodeoxyribonuclease VII large subunit
VTSLGAAALHDVVTALQRRVPHIPVVVAPASVQGAGAPGELVKALSNLYLLTQEGRSVEADLTHKMGQSSPETDQPVVDVILLVRGGGSMEDLWAFNDEQLARTIVRSPVPVIAGVGHETDFTIADFCADLRAPTPTAAAELVSQPRDVWLGAVDIMQERLTDALQRHVDTQSQRLDTATARLGRPSALAARQRLALASSAHRLTFASQLFLRQKKQDVQQLQNRLPDQLQQGLQRQRDRLDRAAVRLGLLDPTLVLQRGYAWLATPQGQAVTSVSQMRPGQDVRATLADGSVDLTVVRPH